MTDRKNKFTDDDCLSGRTQHLDLDGSNDDDFSDQFSSDCNINFSDTSDPETSDDDDVSEKYDIVLFVDLLGFRAQFGSFICKEFCSVDFKKNFYHTFVEPSIPFKKIKFNYKYNAEWSMKCFHRIPYEFGDLPFRQFLDIASEKLQNKIVVVENHTKERWLKYIFRRYSKIDIVNLEELNIASSFDGGVEIYPFCDFHNQIFGWGNGYCAMEKAFYLRGLIRRKMRMMNSLASENT